MRVMMIHILICNISFTDRTALVAIELITIKTIVYYTAGRKYGFSAVKVVSSLSLQYDDIIY
jgi:hypothetical protein